MKLPRNIKIDMGFSSCPQKDRSGRYWLVSHQLDFATKTPGCFAIFFLSPMLEHLAFHPQYHSDRIWHALTSVVISSDCQSLPKPFFHRDSLLKPRKPDQLIARCCIASAHHMRCAGRSATVTAAAAAPRIRQSDFKRPSPDRGAQRPKATTARVYTARSVAGKHARRNSSNEQQLGLRSPRRRPASVSNCCRRPEIPTADSRPRSSVLLKSCLLKNVC